MIKRIVRDISWRLGPVRDQGKRPTCVAFALSDLHASIRSTTFAPLSVEYLFYHACLRSPVFNPSAGVTLHQVLGAIEHDGQPEEVHWPYLPDLPMDLRDYKLPTINATIHRRKGIDFTGAVDEILKELESDRAVMLVFSSTMQFVLANPTVPVASSTSDQVLQPHAVVAVGVGEHRTGRCVRIRNSWGAGWADGGHAWLSESYLNARLISLVRMV